MRVIDSSLCVTIPFPVFLTKHSYPVLNDVKQTSTAGILTAPGPVDKVAPMVRRHPKQM